jgi:hypothetical protein
MSNYLVVLFNNKKRKRILKKFITFSNSKKYYEKLLKKSSEVIFKVELENTNKCSYDLSIIQLNKSQTFPLFIHDDLGRNIKIFLEDPNMSIVEISPYNKEEKLYDLQKNKKITSQQLIKSYLSGDSLKIVSILNNKIIIQKDESFNLFSVKNESEAERFIDSLSSHFFSIKRSDCMFIKDKSTPQRKYLFNLLSVNGYDKKMLYRKFTTHPRQE